MVPVPGLTGRGAAEVRLVERGHDLEELESSFQEWNAQLADDGRLMPDIARV